MRWRPISREETTLYKGLGMLLIVLHNYAHWVAPKVGENEFGFSSERITAAIAALKARPGEAVHLFFSYFGHFGVQVFIFLSAYGLTVAYGERAIRWAPFMGRRLVRLYPTFVLAILAHALFTAWWEPEGWTLWYLKAYALRLSLLSNFVPDMALSVCGPWWFFSFIVQFYALFPLLNRVARRHGGRGLAVVAASGWTVTVLLNPELARYDLNLYYTAIGRLPELCLGIYLARTRELRLGSPLLGGCFVVLAVGNWSATVWPVQSIATLILLLALFQGAVDLLRQSRWALAAVRFTGVVSLPLFAIHGVLRAPFVELANGAAAPAVTLAVAVFFVGIAVAVAYLVMRIEAGGFALYRAIAK